MSRDLTTLIRPETIAVVGASATKEAQGNLVIANLLSRGFKGRIIPVHREASEIQGLQTVRSIAELPDMVDLAVASVPASAAVSTARDLEARQVRSAIYFAAGFSAEDDEAFRKTALESRMNILGPNCMGFINLSDAAFLYPATTSSRLKRGRVALVAQSGSAAITVMNSADFGFSKIITVGSEFQLAAADYLHWLAGDDDTSTVGVVMESIQDPHAFAAAARRLHAAGKSLAVLKVGQSRIGAAATIAHTGAMTRDADTYDLYFRKNGICAVGDYDELAATLQCLEAWGHAPGRRGVALAGISGGQTALACDVAEAVDLPMSRFSPETAVTLRNVLPGTPGQNPVDFGAVVDRSARDTPAAIRAMLADPGVGVLAFVQDCQEGLNERSLNIYHGVAQDYRRAVAGTTKPVVAISPTSGEVHETLRAEFQQHGVPLVRGLREGLVAIKALDCARTSDAATAKASRGPRPISGDLLAGLRAELAQQAGQVERDLALRVLAAYGVPVVAALVAENVEAALARADEVGFPMVVKISSPDIAHRSELGGVVLGVTDEKSLKNAIASITANIRLAAPEARIAGFELQTEFGGDLEAVVGAVASPPFGAKIIVGSGGTLVELLKDTSQGLTPLSAGEAERMIGRTALGERMNGYRKLLPPTDIAPLAQLVENIALMMEDLGDMLAACDLNPVVIRKGTGEVMVVDALMDMRS
ncbi:MAG: acetate--CoA ligase family protein [Paracoccaceae bacterium]